MGSGFNFFLNGLNRSPTTTGAWTDVDVSGDIPSGSTGVILEIVNTSQAAVKIGAVRNNGSTDNYTANQNLLVQGHIFAVIGVDSNRIFEAYIGSTDVQIWLMGYCDENCGLFVNGLDRSITTTGAWTDKDVSADIPSGSTGVIINIINTATTSKLGGIRKNSSTDDRSASSTLRKQTHIFGLCGVDDARIFEGYVSATSVKFYLLGYTKAPVTFFTNEIDKSLTGTGWTDIDVTTETEATADGIIVHMYNTDAGTQMAGEIRKNGSSDDRSTNSGIFYGAGGHIFGLCGMDADQIFEGIISNVAVDFYIIGYAKPAVGVTYVNVSDSGAGADAPSLQAQLPVLESGVGTDAPTLQAQLSLADSGVGSETVWAGIFWDISDSGVGSDMITQLQASIPIGDSGVGAETPSLQASLPISDSGLGLDVIAALQAQLAILESGVGLDVWTKEEIGGVFAGIIRSTLSMLERDMKMEQEEIGMELESLERKMKMELTE